MHRSNQNVSLVDDNHMTIGATSIEYVSSEQITISGIVAKVEARDRQKVEGIIAEFNMSSAVGTMTINAQGVVTMTHFANLKLAKLSEVAQAATMVTMELGRQSGKFSKPVAVNL